MKRRNPFASLSSPALAGVLLAALACTGAVAGSFAVDPGATTPEPVDYGETIELGLSTETDAMKAGNAHIPRAQVFYSQFQYAVGYNGIGALRRSLGDETRESQLGYPIAVYVETFDTAGPTVDPTGLFDAEEEATEWTPATEAWYVVDSAARTPSSPAVVPFESKAAAEDFATAHGGKAIGWSVLSDRSFSADPAERVREQAPGRWHRADATVANATRKLDRPVSVVVGEDVSTIEAALEAAPPNTTVVIPPGTYRERVTVNRSLTLTGHGTKIDGGGNGSVVTVRAPDVAMSGIRIVGTGNKTQREETSRGPDDSGDGAWDERIQHAYGYSDAGIKAIEAPGLLIQNTTVETNATGILLRGGNAVLRGSTVDGTETWRSGFMGVTVIESRVVIEDSSFTGGRDGVYLHRADKSVVRESTFRGNRYGIHTMFSGGTLLADNVIRNTSFGGITVMTQPAGNAIVGNDIRDTDKGLSVSGTQTYIAYNTLADNEEGFSTTARGSLYERNVVVDNRLGAKATTVIPSSRVIRNDFVGNERHASAGHGPLRVWTHRGIGNYWEGAYGPTPIERDTERYSPDDPIDSLRHRERAAVTLAEAPAVKGVRGLLGTTPGMRSSSIVDTAPAQSPFQPGRIEAVRAEPVTPAIPNWRAALTDGPTDGVESTAERAPQGQR